MLDLSTDPKHYPNCCLSLSTPLFDMIGNLIVRNVELSNREDSFNLLSIGCGTGFFENALSAYLQQECLLKAHVEGVETQSTVIPFLAEEFIHRVKGTWDVLDEIQGIHVLLFVYPREGRLVKRYLEQFYNQATIAIWLGPQADWTEHEPILHETTPFGRARLLKDTGLAAYEIAAVFEKSHLV